MMRLWKIFQKSAREQKRDLLVLMLSLAFAPLFVFLYWLITGAGGSTLYGLLVINHDSGNESLQAGEDLNKIFTLGGGLSDIPYELTMLIILSAVYFGLGVIFFRRANLQ